MPDLPAVMAMMQGAVQLLHETSNGEGWLRIFDGGEARAQRLGTIGCKRPADPGQSRPEVGRAIDSPGAISFWIQSKRLELQLEWRKCLHFYFYFEHSRFGFMHLRLQSCFLSR